MTTTTLLSQRARPSLLWSGLYLEIFIGSGLARIPRILCDKVKRGCASRVPASPPASARRTGGKKVEGATPCFSALVRHPAGGGGAPEWSHHLPSPLGVAPSTEIPAGRLSNWPRGRRWGQRSRARRDSRPQLPNRPRPPAWRLAPPKISKSQDRQLSTPLDGLGTPAIGGMPAMVLQWAAASFLDAG